MSKLSLKLLSFATYRSTSVDILAKFTAAGGTPLPSTRKTIVASAGKSKKEALSNIRNRYDRYSLQYLPNPASWDYAAFIYENNLERELTGASIMFEIKEAQVSVFTMQEAKSFILDYDRVFNWKITEPLKTNIIKYFTQPLDTIWTEREQEDLFVLMTARLQAPDFPYMRHFQSSIPYFWENMCHEALPWNHALFGLSYEGIDFKNSSGYNFEKERATALKMFREYHKWLKTMSPQIKPDKTLKPKGIAKKAKKLR